MDTQRIGWKIRGPALRAGLSTLPLAWLIYQTAQGWSFFGIVWVLFSAMAIGGVSALVAAVVIEMTSKPNA